MTEPRHDPHAPLNGERGDEAQPNKRARDVAQRIADVLDEEGIHSYEARCNTMLVATMNACGAAGYHFIVDRLLLNRR